VLYSWVYFLCQKSPREPPLTAALSTPHNTTMSTPVLAKSRDAFERLPRIARLLSRRPLATSSSTSLQLHASHTCSRSSTANDARNISKGHRLRNYIPSLARNATTTASIDLKKTPLHDLHVSHGAKMVPFAGYSMPVQYSDQGVGQSHSWTREKASLFDVSHMYVSSLTRSGRALA